MRTKKVKPQFPKGLSFKDHMTVEHEIIDDRYREELFPMEHCPCDYCQMNLKRFD